MAKLLARPLGASALQLVLARSLGTRSLRVSAMGGDDRCGVALQRPLPDDALRIVAKGEKEDGVSSLLTGRRLR
jgi:hypothetical protein